MTGVAWRALFVIAGVTVLGACHSQPKAGHGEVSGQILPGSVSDAMLPYDSVRSKAPLAPREAETGPETRDDENAQTADTAASSDSAAPDAGASPGAGLPN